MRPMGAKSMMIGYVTTQDFSKILGSILEKINFKICQKFGYLTEFDNLIVHSLPNKIFCGMHGSFASEKCFTDQSM